MTVSPRTVSSPGSPTGTSLLSVSTIRTSKPAHGTPTVVAMCSKSSSGLLPVTVPADRKSTRLNSSHSQISYAVPRHRPSFPTRRSSDLRRVRVIEVTTHDCLTPHREFAGLPYRHIVVVRVDDPNVETRPRHTDRRGDVLEVVVGFAAGDGAGRSEEHTSELQSQSNLVCRPPTPPLFPYTTLFRSPSRPRHRGNHA